MEGKLDRRVKYTKMVLRQSLLELMREKDVSKISVKDICTLADVNRGTFYAHYKDPYDLLEQIENELAERIDKALERRAAIVGAASQDLMCEIFECIAENSDICKILFSDHGDSEFIGRVMNIAFDKCIREWSENKPAGDKGTYGYLYAFEANGCVGVIRSWVQAGMRQPPKVMAELLEKVTAQGLNAYISS